MKLEQCLLSVKTKEWIRWGVNVEIKFEELNTYSESAIKSLCLSGHKMSILGL